MPTEVGVGTAVTVGAAVVGGGGAPPALPLADDLAAALTDDAAVALEEG